MSHEADHHHVRRVVLPSGKTIEVVYFDDRPSAEAAAAAGDDERLADLHRCGACRSDLVYPIAWEEASPRHWTVLLRCPNCEWSGSGTFDQELVERFDSELDHGTEVLVEDLRRLMQANMEEAVTRFVTALQAGHIVPDDF